MEKYKFKTNINCGGCKATVTPYLDNIEGIQKWEVETDHKDKILTIDADGARKSDIQQAVESAGFKIEPLKKGFLGRILNQ